MISWLELELVQQEQLELVLQVLPLEEQEH
jgi:hypothetical protein